INENNTIPVIVVNAANEVQSFRNVKLEGTTYKDSMNYALSLAKEFRTENNFIRIDLSTAGDKDYIDVCYDESLMLKRLASYPYIQLGVGLIFVVIAVFALLAFKRAEQNSVWVGLSKETAHQLGTPISSLLGWIEVLKESYPSDALLPEMEKDVDRLQMIAARFSKIGSLPEPVPTDLLEIARHVVEYMDKRTSKSLEFFTDFPGNPVVLNLNASLFEWVIENLCKNAVDAMGGQKGTILVRIQDAAAKVVIEVTDTGKGIKKKDVKNIFRPGFTTKERGWGLGLSLARRIVEDYHHGRIWVKKTEIGQGTTFRIELKR
ncbi:MAG: HAMP domain-containing histidine kinase, partial [Prevotella sp.]|nr:HAMP domain-containing histidine kinase [Prevotella sp.]